MRASNEFPTLRSFLQATRGSVAVIFSFALLALVLAAGIALDYGRSITMQSKMQAAADAGVLAAVRAAAIDERTPVGQLKQIARDYFHDNLPDTGDFQITQFDLIAVGDGYKINATGQIGASLMAAAGFGAIDIAVSSQAETGPGRPLEVALALDNTGSMSGSKLDSLKSSANILVEKLFKHADDPQFRTKLALVPFAQYVNIGMANRNKPWLNVPDDYTDSSGNHVWNGCAGSRDYPANTQDTNYNSDPVPGIMDVSCPPPVTPLTNDKALILSKVDEMTASGWTYIPSGLAWAWRTLTSHAPYNQAKPRNEMRVEGGIKAIVLMTDGANTRAPSYPDHNSENTTLANTLTDELCTAVKDESITVYTIAFEVTDTPIKTLLQACATKTSYYFDAQNADQLATAFETIAGELALLRLTQ